MPEDIRKHILYLINKFRAENGRPALSLDEGLSLMAKMHSEHRIDRIQELKEGKLGWHTEPHLRGEHSENIGYAEGPEHPFQLAEKIFELWIHDEPHRRHILEARHVVGVDIAHRKTNGNRRIFKTARFR